MQLACLSAAQIQGLTPTQILALSPAQLAALTDTQLAGIDIKCLRLFSEAQKAALGQARLRLVGTLPKPGGWVLDMPWRKRFEWAPRVETETVPAGEKKPAPVNARDGIAEEVEDDDGLIIVLVEEAGEDRFWKAADVAAMMVMDEDDWGTDSRPARSGQSSRPPVTCLSNRNSTAMLLNMSGPACSTSGAESGMRMRIRLLPKTTLPIRWATTLLIISSSSSASARSLP